MNSLPAPAIVALAIALFWGGLVGYLLLLQSRLTKASALAEAERAGQQAAPTVRLEHVEMTDGQ